MAAPPYPNWPQTTVGLWDDNTHLMALSAILTIYMLSIVLFVALRVGRKAGYGAQPLDKDERKEVGMLDVVKTTLLELRIIGCCIKENKRRVSLTAQADARRTVSQFSPARW
jgi:hypothetical protein